jgi:glycerophosphoryl diester phosphodiesterase
VEWMTHNLKNLQHNGICVAPYDYKGFTIRIKGQAIKLRPKSEQMAIALVKKEQSAVPPDKVFYKNFFQDFLKQLKEENPSLAFLGHFQNEHLNKIENDGSNEKDVERVEFDFSEISKHLEHEKSLKLTITREEKK